MRGGGGGGAAAAAAAATPADASFTDVDPRLTAADVLSVMTRGGATAAVGARRR